MNIGCKIVTGHKRTEERLINFFKEYPVANIGDCMNRMACVAQDIKPVNKGKLLGQAFTVKVPHGDNLMFHKAMDLAKPGDIVVIDSDGTKNRAIFGELMIHYCKSRGLAGVIVDGAIRDYDTLSKMDFPIYATGVSPNGPYKNGPGEIGTTICFGGQIVRPGDIIVGDADGIIVIKPEEAEELSKQVAQVFKKESDIMDTMEKDGTYNRPWVDEFLEKIGCEYFDIGEE